MAIRPPSDTVTFLFTDIEGSTRLWEQHPSAMRAAIELHNSIVRSAITSHDGFVFHTAGDSFGAAFANPSDALDAALEAQKYLQDEDWAEVGSISVRMGMDTGLAEFIDGDYMGPPVNRVARVLDQGDGGQILVTSTTADLLRHRLPDGTALRARGQASLKGFQDPVGIYEVGSSATVEEPGRRPIVLIVGGILAVAALLIVGAVVILSSTDETPDLEAATTVSPTTEAAVGGGVTAETEIEGAAWQVALEGRPTEPAISGGSVYVGTDAGGSGHLYAIDLGSGELRWDFETDEPIADAPLEVDGVVYATSRRGGGVVGVNAATGDLPATCYPTDLELSSTGPLTEYDQRLYVWALSWVLSWPADAGSVDQCLYEVSSPPIPAISAGPAVAGNSVFVGAGENVYSFTADTMQEQWRNFTKKGESVNYCGNHDWIDSLVLSISQEGSIQTERLVFSRDWEGRVYRFDAATGDIAAAADIGVNYRSGCPGPADTNRRVRGRPVLTEDAVYAPTFDDQLAALDLDTLDVLWFVPVGEIRVGPALDGDTLFLVTEDRQLWAIDTRRRAVAWSIDTGLSPTGIAASGGVVILTGDFGVAAFRAP